MKPLVTSMNSLRDAMLKAGLITEQRKKQTEYALEIHRIGKVHEPVSQLISEETAAALATYALSHSIPFDRLTGVVIDFIRQSKMTAAHEAH